MSPWAVPLHGVGNNLATKTTVRGSTFTYSPVTVDPLTGLMLQTITFTNIPSAPMNGLRVTLSNIAPGVTYYSSSEGSLPGTVDVIYGSPIAQKQTVTFVLVSSDPKHRTVGPVIKAVALETPEPAAMPVAGSLVSLTGPHYTPAGPLLQWAALRGSTYVVEYSSDGGITWFSAVHLLAGSPRITWVDRGQPETQTKPSNKGGRMYRVKKL